MTSYDEPAVLRATDATFHYGGILLRALGYLGLWVIARDYDFGAAFLAGVLAGDIAGQLLKVVTRWRDEPLAESGELLFLGLVYLCARSVLVWPPDPAMRAIAGLALFGALSAHVGGTALVRLGAEPD